MQCNAFSCAPNPLKCGGMGGCSGSIEPLAYTYASLFGVVTEAEYPYESQYGQNDDVCKFEVGTRAPCLVPRRGQHVLSEHLACSVGSAPMVGNKKHPDEHQRVLYNAPARCRHLTPQIDVEEQLYMDNLQGADATDLVALYVRVYMLPLCFFILSLWVDATELGLVHDDDPQHLQD